MVLVLCVCEGERTDDKCEVQMLCGSGRGDTEGETTKSVGARGGVVLGHITTVILL